MEGLTEKALKTREHIFETAMALFAEKGFEKTTLRDIAAAADCSLGLAYRYFASKEAIVLALYDRLADDTLASVAGLPPKSIADRFDATMKAKLVQLAPYRDMFGAILGATLNPKSEVSVLGTSSLEVRRKAEETFAGVVRGAKDAPKEPQAHQVTEILYSLQLMLILFWLNDPTPNQKATGALLTLAHDMLKMVRRVLRVPPVAKALERLVDIIEPVLGSGSPQNADFS